MSGFPKLDPVFVVQSGIATALASGVASARFGASAFISHWVSSFFAAWATVLLLVPLATPLIRRIADRLTRND